MVASIRHNLNIYICFDMQAVPSTTHKINKIQSMLFKFSDESPELKIGPLSNSRQGINRTDTNLPLTRLE